jgi:NAD(P)-dependent dehydrogenase (short-subunit alcohol dehydrogenase family)
LRLKNKRALITGSANPRGIGFAIAKVFAREGADLLLHYAHQPKEMVEAAIGSLAQYKTRITAVKANIIEPEDVSRMIAAAARELGGLDILVNNSGVCVWETLEEITEAGLRKMTDTNLLGTIRCSREAAIHMREHGVEGRIINISSCNARRPNPGMAGYGGVKAGIDQFTYALALELAPCRITANLVWPGYVITDINQRLTDGGLENIMKTIPLGRLATTEDIGRAALFFAEDANRAVTGAVIKVDGGAFIKSLQ